MARQANPMIKISKKVKQLKMKAEKLNQEIEELSNLISQEVSKEPYSIPTTESEGPKTKAKKVTANEAPKRRGRPRKE